MAFGGAPDRRRTGVALGCHCLRQRRARGSWHCAPAGLKWPRLHAPINRRYIREAPSARRVRDAEIAAPGARGEACRLGEARSRPRAGSQGSGWTFGASLSPIPAEIPELTGARFDCSSGHPRAPLEQGSWIDPSAAGSRSGSARPPGSRARSLASEIEGANCSGVRRCRWWCEAAATDLAQGPRSWWIVIVSGLGLSRSVDPGPPLSIAGNAHQDRIADATVRT